MKTSSAKGWERAVRILLVCLFCWTAGASLGAQQDRIVLKSGKDRQVRIKSEDFDGVRYTTAATGSAETKVAWSEVDSIEYSGGKDYQEALAAFGAGRWSDALTRFDTLLGNADLRPVMRQGALYHGALSNLRLGKPDDALAKYNTLLQEFPKSRYLLPVGSSLLSIHVAKDDAAGAARALQPVLAAAGDSDESLGAALGVLRGRLLEEQKQVDEAEKAYNGALRTPNAEPDVLISAKLGLARCAHKRGNAGEAERAFRELSVADAPNTILAGAWNGLGDIALEAATAKRDQEGLRVALLSYLRGVVLYTPSQGEVSDEYERALAGSSRAFKAIGELEANADRKKQFLDRARQRKDQLAAQFPGSRFLKGL